VHSIRLSLGELVWEPNWIERRIIHDAVTRALAVSTTI
jgi:hypothetical protein